MEDAALGMDKKRKPGADESNHENLNELILQLYLSRSSQAIAPRPSSRPPSPPSSSPSSLSVDLPAFVPSKPATSVAPEEPFNYVPPFAAVYGQTTSIAVARHYPSTIFTTTVAQPAANGPSTSTTVVVHQDLSTSNVVAQQDRSSAGPRSVRTRHNHTWSPHGNKDEHVPPPFEWATNHRATVHCLHSLWWLRISKIHGEVQCKLCEGRYEIEFDLIRKFEEISEYIKRNKSLMHDRAPAEWMAPKLPDCMLCKQIDCLKPVISPKKRSINWLFLLLGKMLGCCTLNQLRYFCKHTKNHRTGAKDRLLYLTYLALGKQLDPDGVDERY